MVPRARGRWVRLGAAAGCLILATLGTAVAATCAVEDPDDTAGRLDLASETASLEHAAETNAMIVHEIRTHPRSPDRLWRSGGLSLVMDTDGDPRPERRMSVHGSDGRLRGDVYVQRTSRRLGPARVERLSPRMIRVSFPRALLGDDVTSYRWFTASFWWRDREGRCGTDLDVVYGCSDRLPDTGWERHQLQPEVADGLLDDVKSGDQVILSSGW